MNSHLNSNGHLLGSYDRLINEFQKNGYETKSYQSRLEPRQDLLLRHDVDFDCEYACRMAEVEENLGVSATYFFLLRSDSYNLLSSRNVKKVMRIKDCGHEISLHFDPLLYGGDFEEGFRFERQLFEKTFQTEIKVISIHRPNEFFLNHNQPIDGVEHTYQDKFFKDIKYFSDSQGAFRFTHPLESEEFRRRDSIQMLIHPIWWQGMGGTNIDVLQNHIENQKMFLNTHVAENCIPYGEFLKREHKN